MQGPSGPLVGPRVLEYTVGSWTPTGDGSGRPEAVAISLKVALFKGSPPVDFVVRLKTPEAVDRLIQMLLRHKRDAWPDAK